MSCLLWIGVGLFFCVKCLVYSVPVSEIHTKYEEYIIEHEISSTQAKNTALQMDISALTIPVGCQSCTRSEIAYCLGADLINDHCCCDKRYHETLPYVPHTCYMGPQLCKPIVGDCEEYFKLKACCCEKVALEKWKAKAGALTHVPKPAIYLSLVLAYFVLMLA